MSLFLLSSCGENHLIKKGFDRAERQYELMYEATPDGMYPRIVNNSGETRLIGALPLKTGANRNISLQLSGLRIFFINHKNLPDDHIPYWDFNIGEFTDYEWAYDPDRFTEEPRDASAAAVTASALLELKDYVEDPAKARQYRAAAVKMLTSLASPDYMAEVGDNNYYLLMHSVASVPHDSSIDKPEAYADYYFLEALLRLSSEQ